jgi:hypothetical protein
LLTATAVLVAGYALLKARRLARRLDRLSESYWELHYEAGQLRARVSRLENTGAPPPEPPVPAGRQGSFVPLSSLKR